MSTFSPNLRLENISTGTQAGAWGNTTNTNICSLLEGAVSGYTTVSVTSANQALLALYGATDEARNAIIRLTTTTTAVFNIYVPPVAKEYTIYNASAYAATIYNATAVNGTIAAGTGITIPAGKTMTVWSNGTNFLQQNTSLADLSLTGVPTAPTAASVTSTTQVATTAFVQAIAVLTFNAIYPVGSIYTNANDATNPGTLLGIGTWVTFGGGKVPVGYLAADPLFGTAGATGGYADSTLVSHTHTANTTVSGGAHTHTGTTATAGSHSHTISSAAAFNANDNSSTPVNTITGSNTAGFAGSATLQAFAILTTDPGHTHTFTSASTTPVMTGATTVTAAGVTGVNQNYQPYITVYMWKRTA